MQGDFDYRNVYHYGIESPCGTSDGEDLNIYYVSHYRVYELHGSFR